MSQEALISLLIGISFIAVIIILWIGLNLKIPGPTPKPKRKSKQIDGDLIIDTKDPHKDVFRFELYYSPEQLIEDKDRQYVTFKIIRND